MIDEALCEFRDKANSRLLQAIEVIKLIWHHRNQCIVLVTYDPMFVPLVRLFGKNILLFEHNTTPLSNWSKHGLWQKLFFGNLNRMAQFRGQYKKLREQGAQVTYIGSPLLNENFSASSSQKDEHPLVFIVPSYRANISDLNRFPNIFHGPKVLVKKGAEQGSTLPDASRFDVEFVDRLEFQKNNRKIDAVVVTVQSRIRGTGWFNDAISNSTPIIVTNSKAATLLKETFPGYPFVDAELMMGDLEDLRDTLVEIRLFNSSNYIEKHNSALNDRFTDLCKSLNLEFELVCEIGESCR